MTDCFRARPRSAAGGQLRTADIGVRVPGSGCSQSVREAECRRPLQPASRRLARCVTAVLWKPPHVSVTMSSRTISDRPALRQLWPGTEYRYRPRLCENCSIAPELGHLSNFTLDSALRAIQCVQWPDMRVSEVPGADFRKFGITKRSRACQAAATHSL